jgi:hypothetical protein
MSNPFEKIDVVCPVCGMGNVWLCSARDCPKAQDQAEVRKAWVDRQANPPQEESNTGVQPPGPRL